MIVINVIEEKLQNLVLDHLRLYYNNISWAGCIDLYDRSLVSRLKDFKTFSLYIKQQAFKNLFYNPDLFDYSSKDTIMEENASESSKIISIERKSFEFINALDNT